MIAAIRRRFLHHQPKSELTAVASAAGRRSHKIYFHLNLITEFRTNFD
jgi:hypothetical protein